MKKDSSSKELKVICEESGNRFLQRLCCEKMNFNPEDFIVCISCYKSLPIVEAFANKDTNNLITDWDYIELTKVVKNLVNNQMGEKMKENEAEYLKQLKCLENTHKKKLEQKVWDKDRDIEYRQTDRMTDRQIKREELGEDRHLKTKLNT